MQAAPRCGAMTRSGAPCQAPAIRGKTRCRKHGGAPRSGGQKNNRNAHKHGLYTAKERALIIKLRDLNREMRDTRREIDGEE